MSLTFTVTQLRNGRTRLATAFDEVVSYILARASVISATTTAEPTSPSVGDIYYIPAGATGNNWSGHAGKVAIFTDAGIWEAIVVPEGFQFYAEDTNSSYVYESGLITGVTQPDYDIGTIASGTLTLNPDNGSFQNYTNNGAHTLAPQTGNSSIMVHITNAAAAGAITTSGYDLVTGDAFTTTDTHEFVANSIVVNGKKILNVFALQ